MARFIHIFVSVAANLDEFAKELEQVLSLSLESKRLSKERWYESTRQSWCFLMLYACDVKNEHNLMFENYDFQLRIDSIGWNDSYNERYRKQNECARQVYARLKSTDRYPLMLVDNLEIKLDEFEPAAYRRL